MKGSSREAKFKERGCLKMRFLGTKGGLRTTYFMVRA